MDPFTGMSQDQMKKLDEVLQSDHARALLQESTVPNDANDVRVLMSTSIESLSSLSDLDNLEPTISVPHEVDVANIACDLFRDDPPKSFDIDYFVLLDHSYSTLSLSHKSDLLDIVDPAAIVNEVEAEEIQLVNIQEITESNSSPIRRSRRQLEKTERDQKETIESASLEDQRLQSLKDSNLQLKGYCEQTSLAGTDVKLNLKTKSSDQGVLCNGGCNGKLNDSDVISRLELIKENMPINKGNLQVLTCSVPIAGKVSHTLTSLDAGIDSTSPSVTSVRKSGIKAKKNRTEFVESNSSTKKGSPLQRKRITSSKNSAKAIRREILNLDLRANPKLDSEDTKKSNSSHAVTKLSHKRGVSQEKNPSFPSHEKKSSKDKKFTPPKFARKKSLSFSEDKTDSKTEIEIKKRHLSVSEKDSSMSKIVSSKPKLKPKKKVSKVECLSADFLGPALFSEPDMMVKVKTSDDNDGKKEKNRSSEEISAKTEPLSVFENVTNSNELDLLKLELLPEHKPSVQISINSDSPVKTKSKELSDIRHISNKKEDVVQACPIAVLEELDLDIGGLVSDKHKQNTADNIGKPIEIKSQKTSSLRSQRCSPSNIKDFLVNKNKEKDSIESPKSQPESNDTCETVLDVAQAVCEKNNQPTVSKPAVPESPKPERKSQRTIQRNKRFDEDYSPERPVRGRKNQKQPANQVIKDHAVNVAATPTPKRETRRSSRSVTAKESEGELSGNESDAKKAEEEEKEWDSDDDPEKIWCICRQPHNNKFMIECDKCQDWFHGTCVNVTRQLGRQLEKGGKEWVCPNCSKAQVMKKRGSPNDVPSPLDQAKAAKKQRNALKKDVAAVTKMEFPTLTKIQEVKKEVAKPASTKTSNAPTKMNKEDKMQTRNPIPKDFVLKSREPTRPKKDVKVEKATVTVDKPVVKQERSSKKVDVVIPKVERTNTRSTLKSEKPAKTDKIQKPNTIKNENPEGSQATKKLFLREVTLKNNEVVKERSFVSVGNDPSVLLKDKVKEGNGESSALSATNSKSITEKPKSVFKASVLAMKEAKKEAAKRRHSCTHCDAKPSLNGSVYCSVSCLEKSAAESIKAVQNSLKPNEDLNSKKVDVIDREAGTFITGANAPTVGELVQWLKSNQTFCVIRPVALVTNKKEHQKTEPKVQQSERLNDDDDERSDKAKEDIRINVRKTLKKALLERCENAEDIKMSDAEVQAISSKIEEEMNSYFKDNSFRYRAKYRSLMFNIKDRRNQGLFRKILKGKILPDQLVRMSTEELASSELAKWREKENQHSLEMIKRMQIEQNQSSAGLRKKTHKGEIEIEEDAIVGLDQVEIEKEIIKTPPRPIEEKVDASPEKKDKVEEKETEKDSTHMHRSHLFDLNCKICTGKMAPPPLEDTTPKKMRVAHSISVERTPPLVSEADWRGTGRHLSVSETSEDSVDREALSASYSSPDSGNILPSKKKESSIWKGSIAMQDVTKFFSAAHRVSGSTDFMCKDIPDTLQVCGRINPQQVWDYLSKVKQSGSKELIIISFSPANEEEAVSYDIFYNYLNSRKRCGVVNHNYSKIIKDFYILPLASHKPVATVLLPFDGPGLPSHRPHLLLGVLVRHRLKQQDCKSELNAVQEKTDEASYTPPLESNSFTPPLDSRSYTPPLDNCAYTPPPENVSYTPPLEEPSYTPPLEEQSYTPPLESLPGDDVINVDFPSYHPTTRDRVASNRLSNEGKRKCDYDDAYEPSYTPPLEKMPKMSNNEAYRDHEMAYRPIPLTLPSSMSSYASTSGGRNTITELMKRITESSVPSSPPLVPLSSDLVRQKSIIDELTLKIKETDLKVNQSLSDLEQLGASSHDVLDVNSHQKIQSSDSFDCIASSGMSSFLTLPKKNLQDILNSVRPKLRTENDTEDKNDTDIRRRGDTLDLGIRDMLISKTDTDIRTLPSYSPINLDPESPDLPIEDIDDRGSSQGSTPPPIIGDDDDENSTASELRPSDPRIKIRTTFNEDFFASEEPRKKSLSTMSSSELLERAQKELEELLPADKNRTIGHYPVPSWDNKEPPPPGTDPADLPLGKTDPFPRSVDSSGHVIGPYPPLPEGHVIAPPFNVPSTPTTPSAFPLPPPGFPLHTPPPTIDAAASFPPGLPPAFLPPPNVPPPPIVQPDGIDQRDDPYFPWHPDGPPPPDVDYRDRPHWDDREWNDWDHRDHPLPPDYYEHELPEEWYFGRQGRSDHAEGRPAWQDRFAGRGPRRWTPRRTRSNHHDANWRGRRNYTRPQRE